MGEKIARYAAFTSHWLLIPLIATCMVLWPTLSSRIEILQSDPGDTLLNAYFLEHAYKHFTSFNIFDPNKFWSPEFFWPYKDTLAWSDHLLGQSVIYGLFRPIFDPIESYVCWICTSLFLNYVSIRRALVKISPKTKQTWLSIATLTTTFSPAIAVQLSHPQLLSLFIIGPILCECHKIISGKPEDYSANDWITVGCLLLINGFFNVYTFVYALYGVTACTFVHIVKRIFRKTMKIYMGKGLGVKAPLLITLIGINLYIYIPYLKTLKSFGSRPIEVIIDNLPKPAGWLLGNDWLLVPPAWNYQTVHPGWISGQEQAIFPGWGLLILLTAAILTLFRKQKNSGIKNWVIVIAIMVLLSLSFGGETAWTTMMKLLPGSGSLRASSRVAMMIILFSAPCVALAAESWSLTLKGFWSNTCEVAAVSASFVSIWAISGAQHQFDYKEWKNELGILSDALEDSHCNVFWYEWNQAQPPFRAHVLAMHAQSRSKIETANGYSGQFPSDDWPFTESSGANAYKWLLAETPYSKLKTKPINNYVQKCTISLNPQTTTTISIFDEAEAQQPKTIFENNELIVAYNHRLKLIAKVKSKDSKNGWISLTKGGDSIPLTRGKFVVTNGFLENGKIWITDTNTVNKNIYIWEIDKKTGKLINETFVNSK